MTNDIADTINRINDRVEERKCIEEEIEYETGSKDKNDWSGRR